MVEVLKLADDLERSLLAVANGELKVGKLPLEPFVRGYEELRRQHARIAELEDRLAEAERGPRPPAVRIYDYVWPQTPEHADSCTYACNYTPAQHLAKGELLAVVHPNQINGYLQRDGSPKS